VKAKSSEVGSNIRLLHFVHTDDSGPFRVGSFHLAREFVDRGVEYRRVLPWRVFWKAKSGPHSFSSLRASSLLPSKIYRIRSLWKIALWINSLFFVALLRGRFKRDQWWPDIIIVDSLYFFGVARLFRLMGVKVIARMTDFIWELDRTLDKERAKDWSFFSLKNADAVIATNSELARYLRAELGVEVSCIPNGVDYDHFSRIPILQDDPSTPLQLVYFGALDERIDYPLLSEISSTDGVFLTVIGNHSPDLRLGKNGRYIGEVAYEKLPDALIGLHAGILPFVDSTANSGRFPMKFFEYAAAGLPIVSFPFPGILAEVTEMEGLFFSEHFTRSSFISCIDRLGILRRNPVAWGPVRESLREYAKLNSWGERADRYLRVIGEILQ